MAQYLEREDWITYPWKWCGAGSLASRKPLAPVELSALEHATDTAGVSFD